MSNDTPKLDDEGQLDRCIGHALTLWNHIEDGLGDTFCAAFGSINHLGARRAFLAAINFNTRLQMTTAAITAVTNAEPHLTSWESLSRKLNKKAAIRNKLTHYHRLRASTLSGEPAVFVLPNFWTGEDFWAANNGTGVRWTWKDIWQFAQDFGTVGGELRKFSLDLERHLLTHPPRFPPVNRDAAP